MVEKIPMTREGYELLRQELKRLKDVERPKIAREIGVARDHGDLSENAEYEAAKDKQGHIEGRIKELEHKVACAELVDISKAKPGTVVFGATVCLEDQDTEEKVVNDSLFFGSRSKAEFDLEKENYGYYLHDELKVTDSLLLHIMKKFLDFQGFRRGECQGQVPGAETAAHCTQNTSG